MRPERHFRLRRGRLDLDLLARVNRHFDLATSAPCRSFRQSLLAELELEILNHLSLCPVKRGGNNGS
jgi:hypothetical protein